MSNNRAPVTFSDSCVVFFFASSYQAKKSIIRWSYRAASRTRFIRKVWTLGFSLDLKRARKNLGLGVYIRNKRETSDHEKWGMGLRGPSLRRFDIACSRCQFPVGDSTKGKIETKAKTKLYPFDIATRRFAISNAYQHLRTFDNSHELPVRTNKTF